MRFLSILFLIFIAATLFIGNTIYQSDLEYDNVRDIENITSNIKWDYNYTLEEPSNGSDIISSRMKNIIHKFIDFAGFTSFEVMKTGIEFGYNNPQYDFEFAFDILKILIIAMIIGALVPLFIPLLAIITIIGIGIINFFKWMKKKNEKTT